MKPQMYEGDFAAGYPIWMEVSGTFGMFADVSAGSEGYSYPLPPASACRGMIASVQMTLGVKIHVVAVACCRQPIWESYAYNSFTALRKSNLLTSGNALQIHETVLLNPCFQILALLKQDLLVRPRTEIKTTNLVHMAQDNFFRRLRKGQCFRNVCLGRKEYLADYFGPPRSTIYNYDKVLPSMCVDIEYPPNQEIRPVFRQNIPIMGGVLHFDPTVAVQKRDGVLAFASPQLQDVLDRRAPAVTKGEFVHA